MVIGSGEDTYVPMNCRGKSDPPTIRPAAGGRLCRVEADNVTLTDEIRRGFLNSHRCRNSS